MTLDPHIRKLADILVSVCVRELQTARRGKEKCPHQIPAGYEQISTGSSNDKGKIEEIHALR